jgi:hypothetical protein
MAKKRRKLSPELRAHFARTMRLLEDRIAYHEQKLAAEGRATGSTPPSQA